MVDLIALHTEAKRRTTEMEALIRVAKYRMEKVAEINDEVKVKDAQVTEVSVKAIRNTKTMLTLVKWLLERTTL